MEETAKMASVNKFHHFTTTLRVSPHKDSATIIEFGKVLAKKYGIEFIERDFKKNNGYKKSIEMTKNYNLYRQNYCGCSYSRR